MNIFTGHLRDCNRNAAVIIGLLFRMNRLVRKGFQRNPRSVSSPGIALAG